MKKRWKFLLGSLGLVAGSLALWPGSNTDTLESVVEDGHMASEPKSKVDLTAMRRVILGNMKQKALSGQSVDNEDEQDYKCFKCDDLAEKVKVKYFSNGQRMVEYTMVCGIEHGWERTWDKSGNLKEKVKYSCGKPDGVRKRYHKGSEQVFSEEFFEMGVQKGKQFAWHESGQRAHEAFLNDDSKKEGKQYGWHEDGSQKYVENYDNGIKDGEQRYWDKEGKETIVVFDNGQEVDWFTK